MWRSTGGRTDRRPRPPIRVGDRRRPPGRGRRDGGAPRGRRRTSRSSGSPRRSTRRVRPARRTRRGWTSSSSTSGSARTAGCGCCRTVAPASGVASLPAVIVLTAYDYPQYAEAALRLGAAGFVLKTAPLDRAVRRHPASRRGRPGVRGPARAVGRRPPDRTRARRRPARRRGTEQRRDRRRARDRLQDRRNPPVAHLRALRRAHRAPSWPPGPSARAGWTSRPPGRFGPLSGRRRGERLRGRLVRHGRLRGLPRLALQRDDREQHRQAAVPQRRQRQHRGDRHRPAAVRSGRPRRRRPPRPAVGGAAGSGRRPTCRCVRRCWSGPRPIRPRPRHHRCTRRRPPPAVAPSAIPRLPPLAADREPEQPDRRA